MPIDNLCIVNDEGTDRWSAFIGEERVATFEYVQDDDGRTWLAEATTARAWRRQGVGRRMIVAAVAYYDEVWASTAQRSDGEDSDTRYLSEAGAALVNACIRDSIMKPEWLCNPYYDDLRRRSSNRGDSAKKV